MCACMQHVVDSPPDIIIYHYQCRRNDNLISERANARERAAIRQIYVRMDASIIGAMLTF